MPNTAVDVNSWAVLACYPRSTFYPLSDGPSIRDRRITKTYFRTCSTCQSRSQALLCLYTHCMISDHAESTFVLLRYSLGGGLPSQTTHQTLSSTRIHESKLGLRPDKGGISRATPPELASELHSLPPILHISSQSPVSSCSKGSRGLSVLPQEHCIFTANSISLSLGWRQCGHRYAIRAGRNLPDKEFRYLRTVIVTAAVYRGFDHKLRPRTNLIN